MKMFIISITEHGYNPVHWAIRKGSGGEYSHTRAGFGEGDTPDFYYESTSTVSKYATKYDRIVTKNGVKGPISYATHLQWHDENPTKNLFAVQPVLAMSSDECLKAIDMLDHACGTIEYDKRQIVQNARYMLTGNMGRRNSIDPRKWTCSETGFRCLSEGIQIELGLGALFLYDWISPSGTIFGLYEYIEILNEAYPSPEIFALHRTQGRV